MRPLLVSLLFLVTLFPAPLFADTVEIAFFSSPRCPFCGIVADRDLDPLQQEYGESLQILTVDTTTADGQAVFHAAWEVFEIPPERRGVPMIVAGDQVLVGAGEIPRELPTIIEDHRRTGGLALPPIPGLLDLADQPPPRVADPDWRDRFQGDLPGNYVSTALLLLMLAVLVALLPHRSWQERLSLKTPFTLRILVATTGLLVAAYLTYGYSRDQELVCGPVGQCNVVQHSDMAWLFGVIPIALLGVLAYAVLLGIYLFGRVSDRHLAHYTPAAALVVSGGGFAFSLLLTFWQPFVIGATCSWCLLSALTMTLSCLFAIGHGRPQLKALVSRA